MNKIRRLSMLVLMSAALWLASCASIADQDIPVYQREAAMIKLAQGDVETANDLLFTSFQKLDPKEGWGSFLLGQLKAGFTDARALRYRPDDYELILMLIYRTITDICLDGRNRADLYLAQERQNALFSTYEDYEVPAENRITRDNYQLLPLPYYLVAARQESTPNTADRASKAYQDMLDILKRQGGPPCPLAKEMVERIGAGNLYPEGGAVHVVGFLGQGPKKIERETMLVPALLTAVKVIITYWGLGERLAGSDISLVSFKYPELIRRPRRINGFSVASPSGLTQSSLITDITRVARAQFEARKPWILAQALLCRLFKEAVVRTTEGAILHNTKKKGARAAIKIGAFLGKAIWEASERADTRCWTLLPDMVHAARVDLPAGGHMMTIKARSGPGGTVTRVQVPDVPVANGKNTFLFIFFPSPGAPPSVIISPPL